MARYICLLILLLHGNLLCAQNNIAGVIVDSDTKQPLPFATIRQGNSNQGIITDINGHFSFRLMPGVTKLKISYVGYEDRIVSANNTDTITLSSAVNLASEVIIRPPYEKIRRIINTAIAHKNLNNPDKYDRYKYDIYYKMKVDLLPNAKLLKSDTARKKIDSLTANNHILFSETYSRVSYKTPGQRQENILASRFSGFKKTYFTNVITDILPFHVYNNYIKLNTVDYINPVAEGWQNRYVFVLIDEFRDGSDTVFVLKYRPKKNAVFNSLKGIVYINTNRYAISHITARTTDSAGERSIKMEQTYKHVNGKWFPRELNYEFTFLKYPSPQIGMVWSGHSIIDSVSYNLDNSDKFDKAHPVKLDDSVDLRTEKEWVNYRFDTISAKERNTFAFADSLLEEIKLDKFLSKASNLAIGRIPVKFVDIDLTKILAYNTYEGMRLGIGLYTNDKISKHFSVGGWFGYGFKDKRFKYGGSVRIFPLKTKENWIEFAYQDNYRNTGNVNISPEIDRRGLQNWLLARVDKVEEVSGTIHGRINYWEIELNARAQQIKPLYTYMFNQPGSNPLYYDVTEASLNIRYAYAEKRTPLMGYYMSAGTKYPVVYMKLSYGNLGTGSYFTNYFRALAAITYHIHINHWGKDNFSAMGGIIKSENNNPLPRSVLMAGNGYRIAKGDVQFYAQGGFLTMPPYSFFSDRFASLMYRHDFDRCFYNLKLSKPYLSIAHNLLYGNLTPQNRATDPGIMAPYSGYHETGIILNQLLRVNYINFAYLNVNAGAYYHWVPSSFSMKRNGRFVMGISLGF